MAAESRYQNYNASHVAFKRRLKFSILLIIGGEAMTENQESSGCKPLTWQVNAENITLDSAFPNGRKWTLYHHDTENKKWTLDTFRKVSTVGTWRQFFELTGAIDYDTWSRGMFFFMMDPIPPLWENSANIRGGNYSMRVNGTQMIDLFIKYCVASILGEATTDELNIVHGIAMTPKKGFFVIKIWNKNCTKYNNPSELTILDSILKQGSIIYTPFVEKRM